MPKIFGVEKPKKWTVFPAISIFSGIWNFFLDGFEPDSSCSADSKKLWVYDDQTCSKAQKCILVRALASTSQKCLQPITMLHSDIHVISLVPEFFFKKNIDLLEKMLGRWPVDMGCFRGLCGLCFAIFLCASFAFRFFYIINCSCVFFLCLNCFYIFFFP